MRRREFISFLGGTAAAWPLAARAQQPALPVVAFINGGTPETFARRLAGFRTGLSEAGYVEGQNVVVEYHWLEGHYDRLPALLDDLVHRGVAVIAIPGSSPAAVAAKAAITTIPIAFGIGEDPVRLGLVTSLARPGGNATGINFFVSEVIAKQLRLLHDLVPKAAHITVLVNPTNAHQDGVRRCLLSGVKRTLRAVNAMSANDPKRTLPCADLTTSCLPV